VDGPARHDIPELDPRHGSLGLGEFFVNGWWDSEAVDETICRGLPVEILVRDYRQVEGRFDAVVSVGMFEHVGPKNDRICGRKPPVSG